MPPEQTQPEEDAAGGAAGRASGRAAGKAAPHADAGTASASPSAAVCPACAGRLYPRELACADCGLLVRTRYRKNEFFDLDDDSLHLLRVFIACKGRIRDMERALGVSYPTVKSRLAALREKLGFGEEPALREPPAAESEDAARTPAQRRAAVLDRLESGEIDFGAAMRLLKSGLGHKDIPAG